MIAKSTDELEFKGLPTLTAADKKLFARHIQAMMDFDTALIARLSQQYGINAVALELATWHDELAYSQRKYASN